MLFSRFYRDGHYQLLNVFEDETSISFFFCKTRFVRRNNRHQLRKTEDKETRFTGFLVRISSVLFFRSDFTGLEGGTGGQNRDQIRRWMGYFFGLLRQSGQDSRVKPVARRKPLPHGRPGRQTGVEPIRYKTEKERERDAER